MSSILAPFRGLALSLSFLTRIPVPFRGDISRSDWNWSFVFFPLAGLIIAFLGILLASIVPFHPAVKAFIFLAFSLWMTRILHLDGFCDCCDAFSAVADKERCLAIMKDPHTGVGAIAGAFMLLLGKFLTLQALFASQRALIVILLTMGLARFGMLLLAFKAKYPRPDGTALNIVGQIPVWTLAGAFVFLMPFVFLVPPMVFAAAFVTMLLTASFWRMKANSKLGGPTGDVLGASCETSELLILLVICSV